MIQIRKAEDRGAANHGWLQARYTFSFASYHDPAFAGFRSLRVMNEDRIDPGKGFGMHPHRDMEIVTYVLEGALEHQDSMGNGEVLRPGEFQRMSAGTGILHSEFNPSTTEPTHLYQIWLQPQAQGIEPSYEQKRFEGSELHNRLRLVASPDADFGSLAIHQQTRIYLSRLQSGAAVTHELETARHAWLQVLRGRVDLNRQSLGTGDGAAVSEESSLRIQATDHAEILLFDLN